MASQPRTQRNRFELEFASSLLLNVGAGTLASLIIYVCTTEFFQMTAMGIVVFLGFLVAVAFEAAYVCAYRARF